MTSPRNPPPGRYPTDRPQGTRRVWFIALTSLVIVAGVFIAWIGYHNFSDPDISGEASGYEILNDTSVEVKFTVIRKDPGVPATCILRARSIDGTETGRREIYVPASAETHFAMSTVVDTSAAPVLGEVYGCSKTVPEYLVAP